MTYFREMDSSYKQYRGNVNHTLQTIANRYIGENPQQPVVYRTYSKAGFRRGPDYRYEFDFTDKLGEIEDGSFVYAWAKLWCDQARRLRFSASCFSPLRVYVNARQVFKSNLNDEVFPERAAVFEAELEAGWNHWVLCYTKTATGCGGRFGTGSIKGAPLHFLAPTPEREGQEGWIYSGPLAEPLEKLPGEGMAEQETGLEWLPRSAWRGDEARLGSFARIFGTRNHAIAFAWAKLAVPLSGACEFQGSHRGSFRLYVDGTEIYKHDAEADAEVPFQAAALLTQGEHDVLVQSACAGTDWGFRLRPEPPGTALRAPVPVRGLPDVWLYLGPFEEANRPDPADVCTMHAVFRDHQLYWQADAPDRVIRAYLESPLFGKWNYPLGVTLYGLLQTGLRLARGDYVDYALQHIGLCTRLDQYSLWDRAQYGAAGVNQQLSAIDSLDDCGSFGATTLFAMRHRELPGAVGAVRRIADYISKKQDRRPDGALYRVRGSTDFMQDTMWCDDLYMSTPFLCRYYQLTGERAYLDDAARQFLLYKKYLYMPDQRVMSHVYDFKFDMPTGIPWGRGNGWVVFSLSELLEVLPDDHESRAELLAFYRELCAGYLALQGANGLWHQVLNDPASYEETSCTSMFIYAFARGVRFAWLADREPYIRAVQRGWEGLTRFAIDKQGHVYGVCRGSGYSFSKSYYKDELTWNLNDTHGIGIVLLAGIETDRLLKGESRNDIAL